jgi:tRNA (guanosine-2'-O-)-methyltransferase
MRGQPDLPMIDEDHLIPFLSDFVTEQRRDKIEEVLSERTKYITVLLEDIYQSQNANAVLRTCDCFGIQDVHIIENRNPYNSNPMVARGADKWLNIQKYSSFGENTFHAVNSLKAEGYRIIATSLRENSGKLSDFSLEKGKCAIVFGNEHQGVSDEILSAADEHLKIPMYGFSQSLNISVSAGIILSHLIFKLKNSPIKWQLTEKEKKNLYAEWLQCSVKNSQMLVNRLLEEK